jgi:hypothetical protein
MSRLTHFLQNRLVVGGEGILLEAESTQLIVLLEGLCEFKSQIISSRIKLPIFRLNLNQTRCPVPPFQMQNCVCPVRRLLSRESRTTQIACQMVLKMMFEDVRAFRISNIGNTPTTKKGIIPHKKIKERKAHTNCLRKTSNNNRRNTKASSPRR